MKKQTKIKLNLNITLLRHGNQHSPQESSPSHDSKRDPKDLHSLSEKQYLLQTFQNHSSTHINRKRKPTCKTSIVENDLNSRLTTSICCNKTALSTNNTNESPKT